MAIQTTKFTPIKARHYTLAETQDEKDAELRRKMILQGQRLNANARQADAQAANVANRQDKRQSAIIERDKINNEVDQGRIDTKNATLAEQETYNREQTEIDRSADELATKKQDELDGRKLSLDTKNSENLQYKTDRQREEDARTDAERDVKTTHKNRTLAVGAIGLAMSDAITAGKYIGDSAVVDLSGEIDALRLMSPHHQWKNTPGGVISEDGSILTLMDGDKVVMGPEKGGGVSLTDGNKVTNTVGRSPMVIKTSYMNQAKRFTEDESIRLLGMESSNGNVNARKDAFMRFKTYEKMANDANEVLNQMGANGVSKELLIEQGKRVTNYTDKAAEYNDIAEGVQAKQEGYNLAPRKFDDDMSGNTNGNKKGKAGYKSLVDSARESKSNDVKRSIGSKVENTDKPAVPLQGDVDIRSEMVRIIESEVKPNNTVSHLTDQQLAGILLEAGITEVLGRQIAQ